jgi:hypothetical protein
MPMEIIESTQRTLLLQEFRNLSNNIDKNSNNNNNNQNNNNHTNQEKLKNSKIFSRNKVNELLELFSSYISKQEIEVDDDNLNNDFNNNVDKEKEIIEDNQRYDNNNNFKSNNVDTS